MVAIAQAMILRVDRMRRRLRATLPPAALAAGFGLSLSCAALSAGALDAADLSLDDLLNTTVTTASKFSQRASEAPSSVTVILGDEIQSHGWRNLGEALNSVSGFQVTTATDYSFLGVRGFSQPGDYNSRILLLIDGIPANDGIFDQAMIGPEFPLDMNLIERIEVVPGPGSALYGGNAFLAVVNVITRSSDSVGRAVSLGAGSDGLARGETSVSGRDAAGRHWLISVSDERSTGETRYFPQWDGVDGSDGHARGLDGERVHRLFFRYGGDDWSVHLLNGERQKDSAGGLYATDFSAPVRNTDITTQLGLRFARPLNEVWRLEGQAYAGDYSWEGRYSYSGVRELDKANSDWVGGNVQLTGNPWHNQTWVLGAGMRDDFRQNQQNDGGLAEGGRRTSSLFSQDEIRFNDTFTLNLGGRYDRDTLGSRQFSPRGALVVNLPAATVLKLLAGKAFRPPNAYETSYSYPGTQLAGGNLKPERVTTGEVVLEQAIGTHGRWTASAYSNHFLDMLGTVTDFATGFQQVQTVGNARTEGLELGARYRFDNGFDVRGSVARQHSVNATGAAMPNSPQRLAKLVATLPVGTCELGWETYYTGPRLDVFGGAVGGQTVSHAALSGRFTRDLRWQLRASNLFDRRLLAVVGAEYSLGPAGNVPTIPDYGRQVQLQLTLDF